MSTFGTLREPALNMLSALGDTVDLTKHPSTRQHLPFFSEPGPSEDGVAVALWLIILNKKQVPSLCSVLISQPAGHNNYITVSFEQLLALVVSRLEKAKQTMLLHEMCVAQ